MSKIKPLRSHKPNIAFLAISGILVFLGLIFLASSSAPLGELKYNDAYYFFKHQLVVGLIPGLVGFLIAYKVYYRRWIKISLILFILSLILLLLVFTPLGIKKKGASRWLNIGGFSFQPSELAKMTFLIYLASWFDRKKRKGFLKGYLPFLVFCSLLGILLIKEPATSMTILIILSAVVVYFLAKGKLSYLLITGLVAIIPFVYIVANRPYIHNRIEAFLNPDKDPYGIGYQTKQSIIALGSGEIIGRGFGKSLLKEKSVPEVIGDSIFAVIGEETGFIGASLLIVLYMLFLLFGFRISARSPDLFAKLLISGFCVIIVFQAFINIFAVARIIPFTGLPLPFISYGGTSLAVSLTMVGIIANVSKYTKEL